MANFNLIPNDYVLQKHPDISWQKWLQMVWNDIEWPFVILLGLASLTLGTLGLLQYPPQGEGQLSFWDSLYESLQLFFLHGNFRQGVTLSIFLQIARFLSPVLTVYVLTRVFMVAFKEQLELFRLVRTTSHFIICGLGQKGLLLTKDLRKSDQQVVVIEQDSNNPYLKVCRELGVSTIIGDARDDNILLKAGVRQARHLIAVCGEDETNVEIAGKAETLERSKPGRLLSATLHITDPYLWTTLREREFANEWPSPLNIKMFNVFDTSARILLRETLALDDSNQQPHLLIIGMGNLAEYLIVHAAQAWCLQNKKVEQKLRIMVVDPNVKDKLANLKIRFPLLIQACEFEQRVHTTNWPTLQEVIFPLDIDERNPITNTYICLDDSNFGLRTGFTLLQFLENQGKKHMIGMTDNSGLATFLRETGTTKFKNMSAFGLLESACKFNLLDDGTHEALARIIHEDYIRREKQKGVTEKNNPVMLKWEELDDKMKESNRRQANHIGIKLAAIGCGIKPWQEYGKEKYSFKQEQLFKMAKMEHERWCEEKKREGWKYGEKRDEVRKLHPDLVDWESLSIDEQKKDIETVNLIPSLLAHAGFQIYKIKNESDDGIERALLTSPN